MAGADTHHEDDIVADVKAGHEEASEAWGDNRQNALEAFDFGRGRNHWPEKVRSQREEEGRPCLTIDKLTPMIRQVVNDARQNKPAIAVHPVDDAADPETAEVFNGLIRHIEQSSDAEVAYDTALEHAATGGFGFFKVNTRYVSDDSFDQDLALEPVVDCFSITPPADAMGADSADWDEAFEAETLSEKAFEKRWPDADPVSFAHSTASESRGAGKSVDVMHRWVREPMSRKIVALSAPSLEAAEANPQAASAALQLIPETMIVDLAVYEANKDLFDALGIGMVGRPREVGSYKVKRCTYSGADELEMLDWVGKWIPIVPVYGEDITWDGKRLLRGMVDPAKDAQRMFNYWRSASTELVALAPKAPFIGKTGQFVTDGAKWNAANTESHAYLEYDDDDGAGPPQRQPFAGVPAGALQEALNASDDIKAILGMYDASLGARSNETSGRAIMARQREGDVGSYHYVDNLSRSIRHAGRILIDLIPKVYGTARVLRVLGPDGNARSVRIAPKDEANSASPQGAPPPGTPSPAAMDQAEDVTRIYVLDAGRYDLTVSAGPSFTSRREEAATQMIELIRAYPAVAPVIGDLLARNLDWPGADEIAERLKAMLPAQIDGENPEATAAQAQMKQMSEIIGQLKGQLAAAKADMSIEDRKVEIDAYEAETGRLKTIAPKGVEYDQMQMAPLVMQSLLQILQSPDILEAAQNGAPPEELMAALAQRMAPPQEDESLAMGAV